jgi:hypothetical protein
MAVDAQGTFASFAGFNLNGLVRFDTTPATCSPSEVTGIDSVTVGTGISSRVVRQYHPGAIEPGTATVELLGTPTYDALDTGMVGNLTIAGSWGSVSYQAMLSKFTAGGSVGELVRSTMEFQFI